MPTQSKFNDLGAGNIAGPTFASQEKGGFQLGQGIQKAIKAIAGAMSDGGQVNPNGPQSALGQMLMQMRGGGMVPGTARVAGDSPKNDTVPIRASPGEIVIPRTIAQSDDAPAKAAEFVAALRKKHYAKGGTVEHPWKLIEALKAKWNQED